MKVYSIGRETGCDILINDNTDVISRRHAVLNVSPTGKMTIVDQSQNGTYVNGIRISRNVPVPVTRKDNISFAHVARLDWGQVPSQHSAFVRYATIGGVAVAILVGVVFGLTNTEGGTGGDSVAAQVADSIAKRDSIVRVNSIAKRDSIARVDSIAKRDSIRHCPATKPAKSKKKAVESKTSGKAISKPVKPTDKEKKQEPTRLR